ncbi:MAG: gluconokinase [Bacteroidota bacterium]
MKPANTIYIIMGVSGSGKTTVGALLAKKLGIPFLDGDDYHPKSNIEKMASGKPLDDIDRKEWLLTLNQLAKSHLGPGAVIACSALKKQYREILRSEIRPYVKIVFLNGSIEAIRSRMEKRTDHFMPVELLKSQFDALEIPSEAISVSVSLEPSEIVKHILNDV